VGSRQRLDPLSNHLEVGPRDEADPGRCGGAYNIWIGAGSVWVATTRGAALLRVSPSSGRVVARVPVGDGPADMVFRGAQAWVVTHRDNTLYRIDTTTNAPKRLGVVGGGDDAAERLALLGTACGSPAAVSE
jgi:streptogramin lyase